jgi:4-hydroxy-4-methyl-2-oxoglutarate aldolase
LVIDMGGDHGHAPVGAVTGCAAKCAGAAGIVVDGVVTDIRELREAGLPVYARGTSCLTTKRRDLDGSVLNQAISCAGVIVEPGNLVLGDDNGLLFTTESSLNGDIIDAALAADRAEPELLGRLMRGERADAILKP